ncbi:MAG: hypothetical protein ABIE47_08170 [Pseudomonadota bacterium]
MKKKNSAQAEIFSVIKEISGQNNSITVPRIFVKWTRSLDAALFLSQLLYWSDKGKSEDGWIYKTYREWQEETCLTEYQIRKSARLFTGWKPKNPDEKKQEKDDREERFGNFLKTKVKKVNGTPTVHYLIKRKAFMDRFLKFLSLETEKTSVSFINKDYLHRENFDSSINPFSESQEEQTKKDLKKAGYPDSAYSVPMTKYQ